MTRLFRSTALQPHDRGVEFGRAHSDQIRSNIETYKNVFAKRGKVPLDFQAAGAQALGATNEFAPALHDEMLGLAEGAKVDPALIGMLNARTEILAMLDAQLRGECSAVIHVPSDATPPTAVQTWDWYYGVRNSWLVWEIPLSDGSVTKTMTEYGIVGKAGLNTRGIGLLFTILHHVNDGKRMGVPVHVAARWALDTAPNIARAAQLLAGADVSASSSLNLVSYEEGVAAAITVELHPDGPGFSLPDDHGWLVHTNHFLAEGLSVFDTEPKIYPDTLLRRNLLTRRMAALRIIDKRSVLAAMASHSGRECAVCCHHVPSGNVNDAYETLATVTLDLAAGTLSVHDGGPCSHPAVNNGAAGLDEEPHLP